MPAAQAALNLSGQAVLPAAALGKPRPRWEDALAAIDGAMVHDSPHRSAPETTLQVLMESHRLAPPISPRLGGAHTFPCV